MMSTLRTSLLLTVALMAASTGLAGAESLGDEDRVALQAAMYQHIDQHSIDGLYLYEDFETGDVRELAPAKAHPMILTMGDHFVLCTDFRGAAGEAVNVDFYMTRSDAGFTVFQAEVDNRSVLQPLIKAGKASPVN